MKNNLQREYSSRLALKPHPAKMYKKNEIEYIYQHVQLNRKSEIYVMSYVIFFFFLILSVFQLVFVSYSNINQTILFFSRQSSQSRLYNIIFIQSHSIFCSRCFQVVSHDAYFLFIFVISSFACKFVFSFPAVQCAG